MQTVDKKLKSHDAWALFLSIGGGLCFGTSIGIIGGILGDEKFIGLSPSMRGVFSASAAYGIVIGYAKSIYHQINILSITINIINYL